MLLPRIDLAHYVAGVTKEALPCAPRVSYRSPYCFPAGPSALLAREKAFSGERDALSAARRELPMVKVQKPYVFEGPSGKRTLASLFDGKRQLIVYHFMFDPSWDAGCKSCSLVADHFDGMRAHLGARDISFAAVSRAPLPKLVAFQKRMAWTFPWLSSHDTDFNYDHGVSFRDPGTTATYNCDDEAKPRISELPGLSVFLRNDDDVFHTYSTYARGLDLLIGAYNFIDLTPIGRDEGGDARGMAWVKHHDIVLIVTGGTSRRRRGPACSRPCPSARWRRSTGGGCAAWRRRRASRAAR